MATKLDVTHQQIYADIRAFVLGLLDCEVIQAYSNNVPLPKGEFVMMTILHETPQGTNEHDGQQVSQVMELHLQLDFFGKQSAEMARTVCQMWRDPYACERLKYCQPLFHSDIRHISLTNEESQYERRYSVDLAISYHQTLILN